MQRSDAPCWLVAFDATDFQFRNEEPRLFCGDGALIQGQGSARKQPGARFLFRCTEALNAKALVLAIVVIVSVRVVAIGKKLEQPRPVRIAAEICNIRGAAGVQTCGRI